MAKTPPLKIVGLHVEGLRALRRVDWPADGMGWGDAVPDVVVIGGVNGSGKTTLLELLFDSVRRLQQPAKSGQPFDANRALLELGREILQQPAEPTVSFDALVKIQVRGAGRDTVFSVSLGAQPR